MDGALLVFALFLAAMVVGQVMAQRWFGWHGLLVIMAAQLFSIALYSMGRQ